MFLIIQKKVLDTILDLKFIIFFGLAALLLVFSTMAGFADYNEQRQAWENNRGQMKEIMAARGSYQLMQSEGITVRRKPEKLSIFYRGVAASTGQSAPINNAANVNALGSRNSHMPLFAALGDIDYGYIFKYIFSLFALVLAFDAVSGERERGTLKLMLSTPLSRAKFITGTALGGLLTLWIAILLPVLLSTLLGQVIWGIPFSPAEWLLFTMQIGTNLAYLGVFYLIGLALSASLRSSFSSFLFSLAAWIVLVAIVPVFAIELASRISPAPSIDEVEAEIAAVKRENAVQLRDDLYDAMTKVLDADARDTEGVRQAEAKVRKEARNRFLQREESIHQNYMRRQLRLAALAKSISRVSPAATVSFASSRLAGTDEQLMNRFLEDARRYRVSYLDYAGEMAAGNFLQAMGGTGRRISTNVDDGILNDYNIQWFGPNKLIDVSNAPEFRQHSPSTSARILAAAPDIGLLMAEMLVLMLLCVALFNRYDVR